MSRIFCSHANNPNPSIQIQKENAIKEAKNNEREEGTYTSDIEERRVVRRETRSRTAKSAQSTTARIIGHPRKLKTSRYIPRPYLDYRNERDARKKKKKLVTFFIFPAEVRVMIFQHCMEWNGRTPSVLAAVRRNDVLYNEAIKCFRQTNNTYTLNKRNGWSFCQMGESALLSVKKLKIEIL